jgi:archaellum component FlaC
MMVLKTKSQNLDKILATLKELAAISASTSKEVQKIAKTHGKTLREEYVSIAKELTHVGKNTFDEVRTKLMDLKKESQKEDKEKASVKKKAKPAVKKKTGKA